MYMDFTGHKSLNGVEYEDFLKKARENKKFEFTLDGNTYRSDEYQFENAKFWRMFRNNETLIPLKIFISFEDHMEDPIFGENTFPERFEDITIVGYDFVIETPQSEKKKKNKDGEEESEEKETKIENSDSKVSEDEKKEETSEKGNS